MIFFVRLIKKKSETIQITNIINESRNLTAGFTDINMRISKYFDQVYTHKFDKLHERKIPEILGRDTPRDHYRKLPLSVI